MAKWFVRLHGVTAPIEFNWVSMVEESEGFTLFKDSKGNEIGRIRTAQVDAQWKVDTDKPMLADRTPEELETLRKLITQAEKLGYAVTVAEKDAER